MNLFAKIRDPFFLNFENDIDVFRGTRVHSAEKCGGTTSIIIKLQLPEQSHLFRTRLPGPRKHPTPYSHSVNLVTCEVIIQSQMIPSKISDLLTFPCFRCPPVNESGEIAPLCFGEQPEVD
ncbi:hypothetical protein [Streptomyces sp. NPDC000410]|uniref:hypothetical protein n=1 Tax=Streptomyces sp. NPDC000410 TaxID=3154254 RepID=UPI00331E55FF